MYRLIMELQSCHHIKNGQLHVETIFAESKKYNIDKYNLKNSN